MSKTALEFALDRIRPDADVDSLLPVFSHVATWIAKNEHQALSVCHDRVREVRAEHAKRKKVAGVPALDIALRIMLTMIGTHLSRHEEIERMKRLIVEIKDTPLWRRILWTLSASPPNVSLEDLGKVIGKQGRTIRAIRTLVSATAMKTDEHASLEVIE